MELEVSKQEAAVYSREFSGTPKLYLRVAIASGVYLGLGIFLVYACIRYYFAGDASAFSTRGLLYLGLFLALYIPFAYRTILKYDGISRDGRSWVQKEVTVKLIERKTHRRFG
jgi:pilus assembly protein TadC